MPWTAYDRVPRKQWEYHEGDDPREWFVGRITQYWADSFRWADYATPGTPSGEEKTLLDAQAALLLSQYQDENEVLDRLPPTAFGPQSQAWLVAGDLGQRLRVTVVSRRFLLMGKPALAVRLATPLPASIAFLPAVVVPESALEAG